MQIRTLAMPVALAAVSVVAVVAIGYGYRTHDVAMRGWQAAAEARAKLPNTPGLPGAAEFSDAMKVILARNAGIVASDTPETIALKLTSHLHHATKWGAPPPYMTNDPLRYALTISGEVENVCSSLAATLVWALRTFDIPARIVAFGSKEFAEQDGIDSHVVVSAMIDGEAMAFDPTFNARYTCGGDFVSAVGMHECVRRGDQLEHVYISEPAPGRGLDDYYTPLQPLLYAVSATENPEVFGTVEFPAPGWLKKVLEGQRN